MQIEIVSLRDDLSKLSNSIEIIQQEKENSYQLYQESEITNAKLIAAIESNSEKFIQTTLENTEISNNNLFLKKDLEAQTLANSQLRVSTESSVQNAKELQLKLQKSKKELVTLQESFFTEKLKTNVILLLNVSTSLVPGQTYGRFVKTFQASVLASRVIKSPAKESNQ